MRKVILTFLVSAFVASLASAQDAAARIHLNQIGYYPDASKFAVVTNATNGEFLIISVSGTVEFRSMLSPPRKSEFSGDITRVADFSAFRKPGVYVLSLPASGDSYEFEIKPAVFTNLTKALIKSYYFQRMSTPIVKEFGGKWNREEGHPDTRVIIHPAAASPNRPAGTTISSPKGWYDAGDYNKYIVNSGITMGTLLSLYEDFPSYFDTLNLKIPESRNGAPDLLDEIAWNLRWMLTMQDPSDGGVYNKVTNPDFDDMIMPSEADKPRYVVPKGTAATLDFAAVMAQAARVYGNFKSVFPGLADSCMNSAEKAWKWALKYPDLAYDQNAMNKKYKPVINTGGYGDNEFRDEFIWAAAELYASTGNEGYYTEFPMIPDNIMTLPSWNDVKLLGYYTLARFENKITGAAKKEFPLIKENILKAADNLTKGVENRAYQTVMGGSARDFVWGSNSVAANQGILLIQAYRLSKERKYLDYALTNLDYILGRNATGYSFVTGYGDKTPMFPHHRLAEADGIAAPIPGFIAGGPNPGQQDGCKTYPSRIPDESYTDEVCSYASNEIAINWNAPAAYLTGALEALFAE